MYGASKLTEALTLLGEILTERGYAYDLVLVGGAALVLQNLSLRSTQDCDAVALVQSGDWTSANPLPEALVQAIHDVALTLDLLHTPRDDKDWLNSGPAQLFRLGLPEGFRDRVTVRHYGGLTVRIASRPDLITLKLWAVSASSRTGRQRVDEDDLRALLPTPDEWREAITWCVRKDGRPDFFELDIAPVLRRLGVDKDIVRP